MSSELLLATEFPELAAEVTEQLLAQGEASLAASIPELRIVDRCRCGDEFCATMYTQPRPKGPYPPSHRNIEVARDKGYVILDVVDEQIACVEVLYRPDVRRRLLALVT